MLNPLIDEAGPNCAKIKITNATEDDLRAKYPPFLRGIVTEEKYLDYITALADATEPFAINILVAFCVCMIISVSVVIIVVVFVTGSVDSNSAEGFIYIAVFLFGFIGLCIYACLREIKKDITNKTINKMIDEINGEFEAVGVRWGAREEKVQRIVRCILL